MKESLKSSSKTLYAVCICIVALMVVCYFGTSMTKGTYSASECPTGYTFNGTNCLRKVNGYYESNVAGTNAPCTMGGSGKWLSCEQRKTINDDGDEIINYYCSGTCYVNATTEDGKCYTANNKYQWSTVNLGSPWVEVSGKAKEDCTGCKDGYAENNDGDCVPKSSIGKCYICLGTSGSVSSGGYYQWSSPGNNCHVAESTTCTGTPSPKKYECTLTDNSKVCVTAYDSAWAGASVSETGTSCKEVTSCSSSGGGNTPSDSSTPSSSTPSSSTPSSTPSSSSNVEDNPKTGSVAIFLVWIIALGTLVYAGVYFKQVRENN